MPHGLVAEDARDSNLTAPGDLGVLLIWNVPEGPVGSMVKEYMIERKVMGEDSDFEELGTSSGIRTTFTDSDEPDLDGGEVRYYRVAAVSGTDQEGAWATVRFPADTMMVPSKPTLSAMKVEAMPGSQVKLTWTAPDMNADDVTGYIIERKYDDDMVGDIPSDGYNTDAMGAMHAFMDYKEWWETLNCKGMLAVAEAADNADNRDMYCKHFLDTYPTKIADTETNAGKKISDGTAMKVKDLFMKRYVTDDMGKTMTMFTGMMYTDMDLMEGTEYTYRVRAIHGMKAGMWSDTAMAMTDVIDKTLTAPTEMDAVVSGTDPGEQSVTVTWKDGMNADRHVVFLFDSNFEVTPARIAGNQTDESTVFSNVPVGTYHAVVVAVEDSASGNFVMNIKFAAKTVTVN